MKMRLAAAVSVLVFSLVRAEEQVWDDNGADNVWSTNAANWAGAALWTNGNSAVFSGAGGTLVGETVDVSAQVMVGNVTFQTNGYVVADADADGVFSLVGGGNQIGVPNSNDMAVISAAIAGVGFTKSGDGLLQLAGANTFTGVVRVTAGTLRLSKYNTTVLGSTGTGHGTVVEDGATLDIYGAYTTGVNRAEDLALSGAGVNGVGALINTGVSLGNSGFSGITTLNGDTTIGCYSRIDFRNTVMGNSHTLTKIGNSELAVGVQVLNCPIVINAGTYTYMNALALGSADFDTTINGGALRSYGNQTVTEHLTFNGGSIIASGSGVTTFKINGTNTLNAVVGLWAENSNILELNGLFEGTGGLRKQNGGTVYFLSDTSTYTGPTVVDGGNTLYVGRTNLYAGVLGSGPVTNAGTLYGYSARISKGSIVNTGSIYCKTGALCGASVVNNGNIYFDRSDALTLSNALEGAGSIHLRYDPSLTFDGVASTNGSGRVGSGTFTLTNGTFFRFTGEMQVADRQDYSVDPTNVVGVINVPDGCTLMAQAITFGNGATVTGGSMTGILNQTGGSVITTGRSAEDNGIRLGHYPQARSFYNMMGGTLIIGADYDLGCATDGQGWFNMTGGEVFTKRVMLNERTGSSGYDMGRLTVAGGVLNVGSLTGSDVALSNGICADPSAPYLVELGGAGGTIRAVTNLWIPARATLFGSGADAITFDSSEWTISMTNVLSGDGGLNKAGSGTLLLSGKNSFKGLTQVAEGTLLLGGAGALTNVPLAVASGAALDLGGFAVVKAAGLSGGGSVSNGTLTVEGRIEPGDGAIGTLSLALANAAPGGVLTVDVATNGTCDVLQVTGDLDLAGMTLEVADPGQLNTHLDYTVITFTGALAGSLQAVNLPSPWYVMHDRVSGRVVLSSKNGTLIRVN